MFTDVEASQTSVTVTVGPPMYEGPLDMHVHIGKGAAAWNAVLRVLGDLDWPCRLCIFLPRSSEDDDGDEGDLHPLVLTAWRCLLRAIDHLLTCGLRPLTPFLAAAGACKTTARSSLPAWQRACILPLAVTAGAAVGMTTGLGMMLWNLAAFVGLLVAAVGSLAGAAAAAVAAVVALAVFGITAAIAGGIGFAVAHAAKAGAAGAVARPDQQALPQAGGRAVLTEATVAAERQRRLAAVFSRPWAKPLPVFRVRERDSTRVGSYRIRNSLADAGNSMATAGVRLASPVVLAFGLVKVAWDTWPLLLRPLGVMLGAVTGFLLGVGIGGCGILWNMVAALFDLVEAAWHTAQQGIAALLVAEPAGETTAAAAATAAARQPGVAAAAGRRVDMQGGADGSAVGASAAAGADAKEELELAELP